METLVITMHILFCIILMLSILLQSGKGAELGATFGGSSQTIFGSRGSATFMSKVTAACAVGFMVTSLSLAWLSSDSRKSSIMDSDGGITLPTPGAEPAGASNEAGVPGAGSESEPAVPGATP